MDNEWVLLETAVTVKLFWNWTETMDDGGNGGVSTKSFGRNSQSFYANVINSVQWMNLSSQHDCFNRNEYHYVSYAFHKAQTTIIMIIWYTTLKRFFFEFRSQLVE